jgi:hypothetical protein
MAAEVNADSPDNSLMADAIHRMSHDLAAIRELLERHSRILEGYQTGGLLGARAARKAARQETTT